MNPEGRLSIQINPDKASVNRVVIRSTRPVYACRVFKGKPVAESLALLPVLFSVCGTAQSCAAVRACEHARSVTPVNRTEAIRDCLVNMETLREHLWQVFLDWPKFLQMDIKQQIMVEIRAIQSTYQQALLLDQPVFSVGGIKQPPELTGLDKITGQLSELLRQQVFGCPPEQWLSMDSYSQLLNWLEHTQTIAADMLKKIISLDWADSGRCEITALPELDNSQLSALLQQENVAEQPQWQGQSYETSSFTRTHSPLLNVLKQQYGNSLLVRMTARLTEIAQLSLKLIPEKPADLEQHSRGSSHSNSGVVTGIGQADAARGQLIHQVSILNNQITDYQILAPTEWNFHPEGVVAGALAHLQGYTDNSKTFNPELQAHLIIKAIDPCVAYQLEIEA